MIKIEKKQKTGCLYRRQEKPLPAVSLIAKKRANKRNKKWLRNGTVSASFSVEASYVMAIVFLAIAFFLRAAFALHNAVLGTAVLNEAIEIQSHLPETEREAEGDKLQGKLAKRLEGMLSEKRYQMKLKKTKDGIEGEVKGIGFHGVLRERAFQPEKMMRRITLLDPFMEQ